MSELRPALVSFLLLTLITGVAYPLLVTGIGQAMFSDAANGSLLREGDQWVGSRLIGQPFSDPKYFLGRPSATAPQPYNGAASSGSNQGPTNPALAAAVADRVAALRALDPDNRAPVPIDLVTASGSGLDPHISPAAAEYQVGRVARARNRPEKEIRALVQEATEGRTFGILGEPRVNVLLLNLALDGRKAS
jgi:K+-transporting ATPase ATPase C chain